MNDTKSTIPELPAGTLSDSGDTHDIIDESGTWTWRLTVEPDDLSYEDLEDPAVFGRIAFTSHEERPAGFDGAASKLHLGNNHPQGEDVWWQPPPTHTSAKRWGGNPDDFDDAMVTFRRHVIDILSYGYIVVVLTLSHTRPDGYEREWSASLGGIEPFPDQDYLATVADELADDIASQTDDDR